MNSINDYYKIRNCNMDSIKIIINNQNNNNNTISMVEEVKMIFSLIVKFGKFNL